MASPYFELFLMSLLLLFVPFTYPPLYLLIYPPIHLPTPHLSFNLIS